MEKWIRRLTRLEIVLVFLVIIAGSVVRMTGSGMGCPDWPKCFGHLIPPTDRAQLDWLPNHTFTKGQIIIADESLQVAANNFTSTSTYNKINWKPYTKHNYAEFNPVHTWIEYINRLFGALSGIPMLLLVFISALYLKKNWKYFALSISGLFLLGFEAWLGKLVVDGNLIPGSITIHMLGSLVIIGVLMLLLRLVSDKAVASITKKQQQFLLLTLLLTILQIGLGTQVREQIDVLNDEGLVRSSWINRLNWQFLVHRSLSIVFVILNVWIFKLTRSSAIAAEYRWVLILIGFEIFVGVALNYFGMPLWAQPTHLLIGTLLFAFQTFAYFKVVIQN